MSCRTPLTKRDKHTKKLVLVPCGKCAHCRSVRASAWSFRLMQEEKRAYWAYFITLTYRNDNVPRSKNGFLEVSKVHLQLFFKRLRKMQSSKRYCKKVGVPYIEQSVKYYAVGEYGGKFKRPHYHVILFNASPELVERAWKLGHVHYGFVSGASVGYTMKYISKPWQPAHRNDDRTPVFSLMSKGLGECYLTANMIFWHKRNTVMAIRCYVTVDGKQIKMPRYYRDRLYSKDEKKAIAAQVKKDYAFDWDELQTDIVNYKKLGLYGYKKTDNLDKVQRAIPSKEERREYAAFAYDPGPDDVSGYSY